MEFLQVTKELGNQLAVLHSKMRRASKEGKENVSYSLPEVEELFKTIETAYYEMEKNR